MAVHFSPPASSTAAPTPSTSSPVRRSARLGPPRSPAVSLASPASTGFSSAATSSPLASSSKIPPPASIELLASPPARNLRKRPRPSDSSGTASLTQHHGSPPKHAIVTPGIPSSPLRMKRRRLSDVTTRNHKKRKSLDALDDLQVPRDHKEQKRRRKSTGMDDTVVLLVHESITTTSGTVIPTTTTPGSTSNAKGKSKAAPRVPAPAATIDGIHDAQPPKTPGGRTTRRSSLIPRPSSSTSSKPSSTTPLGKAALILASSSHAPTRPPSPHPSPPSSPIPVRRFTRSTLLAAPAADPSITTPPHSSLNPPTTSTIIQRQTAASAVLPKRFTRSSLAGLQVNTGAGTGAAPHEQRDGSGTATEGGVRQRERSPLATVPPRSPLHGECEVRETGEDEGQAAKATENVKIEQRKSAKGKGKKPAGVVPTRRRSAATTTTTGLGSSAPRRSSRLSGGLPVLTSTIPPGAEMTDTRPAPAPTAPATANTPPISPPVQMLIPRPPTPLVLPPLLTLSPPNQHKPHGRSPLSPHATTVGVEATMGAADDENDGGSPTKIASTPFPAPSSNDRNTSAAVAHTPPPSPTRSPQAIDAVDFGSPLQAVPKLVLPQSLGGADGGSGGSSRMAGGAAGRSAVNGGAGAVTGAQSQKQGPLVPASILGGLGLEFAPGEGPTSVGRGVERLTSGPVDTPNPVTPARTTTAAVSNEGLSADYNVSVFLDGGLLVPDMPMPMVSPNPVPAPAEVVEPFRGDAMDCEREQEQLQQEQQRYPPPIIQIEIPSAASDASQVQDRDYGPRQGEQGQGPQLYQQQQQQQPVQPVYGPPPPMWEEPPKLDAERNLWRLACKVRVWDLRRRYSLETIRSLVTQEAHEYYERHGFPLGYYGASSSSSAGGSSLGSRVVAQGYNGGAGAPGTQRGGAGDDHSAGSTPSTSPTSPMHFMDEPVYDWEIAMSDEDEEDEEDYEEDYEEGDEENEEGENRSTTPVNATPPTAHSAQGATLKMAQGLRRSASPLQSPPRTRTGSPRLRSRGGTRSPTPTTVSPSPAGAEASTPASETAPGTSADAETDSADMDVDMEVDSSLDSEDLELDDLAPAAEGGDEEDGMQLDLHEALHDPSFNLELSSPTSPTLGGTLQLQQPQPQPAGVFNAFYVPPPSPAIQNRNALIIMQQQQQQEDPTMSGPPPSPSQTSSPTANGEGSGYDSPSPPSPSAAIAPAVTPAPLLVSPSPTPTPTPPLLSMHMHMAPILELPPPRLSTVPVWALRSMDMMVGGSMGKGTPVDRGRAAQWARARARGETQRTSQGERNGAVNGSMGEVSQQVNSMGTALNAGQQQQWQEDADAGAMLLAKKEDGGAEEDKASLLRLIAPGEVPSGAPTSPTSSASSPSPSPSSSSPAFLAVQAQQTLPKVEETFEPNQADWDAFLASLAAPPPAGTDASSSSCRQHSQPHLQQPVSQSPPTVYQHHQQQQQKQPHYEISSSLSSSPQSPSPASPAPTPIVDNFALAVANPHQAQGHGQPQGMFGMNVNMNVMNLNMFNMGSAGGASGDGVNNTTSSAMMGSMLGPMGGMGGMMGNGMHIMHNPMTSLPSMSPPLASPMSYGNSHAVSISGPAAMGPMNTMAGMGPMMNMNMFGMGFGAPGGQQLNVGVQLGVTLSLGPSSGVGVGGWFSGAPGSPAPPSPHSSDPSALPSPVMVPSSPCSPVSSMSPPSPGPGNGSSGVSLDVDASSALAFGEAAFGGGGGQGASSNAGAGTMGTSTTSTLSFALG